MGFNIKDKDNPDGDIKIEYTGLRPGEKLYEELLIGDNATGTSHPRIMRAEEEAYTFKEINTYLDKLKNSIKTYNIDEVRQLLIEVVKGYQPSNENEDFLWKQKQANNKSNEVVELTKYYSKDKN